MRVSAIRSMYAVLCLAAVFGHACSRDSSARSGGRPPSATVSAKSGRIVVGPASYCWDGLCADGILDVATAPVLAVQVGETMELKSSALGNARSVAASARPLEAPAGRIAVTVRLIDGKALLTAATDERRIELDVLISVDGGDVGYSWLVDPR